MPQVAARKSVAGTGAFMTGRSLGLFGIHNPLRLAVFKVMYSQVRMRMCVYLCSAPISTTASADINTTERWISGFPNFIRASDFH